MRSTHSAGAPLVDDRIGDDIESPAADDHLGDPRPLQFAKFLEDARPIGVEGGDVATDETLHGKARLGHLQRRFDLAQGVEQAPIGVDHLAALVGDAQVGRGAIEGDPDAPVVVRDTLQFGQVETLLDLHGLHCLEDSAHLVVARDVHSPGVVALRKRLQAIANLLDRAGNRTGDGKRDGDTGHEGKQDEQRDGLLLAANRPLGSLHVEFVMLGLNGCQFLAPLLDLPEQRIDLGQQYPVRLGKAAGVDRGDGGQ